MTGIFFFLLSFLLSIAVVWYRLTSGIMWLCFLFAAIATLAIRHWRRPVIIFEASEAHPLGAKNFLLPLLFFALLAVSFVLLIRSGGEAALQTPWQAIHPWYLPVFFLLVFILGAMLLTPYKTKKLLGFIVLLSFIQHLYLPLSHELPWGGDVWRHMAVEAKLLDGKPELPVLFGDRATFPDALLVPQKYSYGQLWGMSVASAKFFHLPLLTVNIWLMPVLWSIAMPLLLFRIGTLLFQSRRWGLWLALTATLPFPFQALGSLTLPVSLGYLNFFFALMLWLEYLYNQQKSQRNLAFLFAALMIFGYSLHFILIWTVIAATYLIRIIAKIKSSLLRRSVGAVGLFVSIFIIPIIELVANISYVPQNLDLILNLKQFIGQFSGWYFASGIRPHDMLSGNFLFNHTPSYAFVSSLFMDWRWWIVLVIIIVWLIAKYGITRFLVSDVPLSVMALVALSTTVVGGYVIGWFILDGDRLLTRRLDAMMAFVLLIFFLYGIKHLSAYGRHIAIASLVIFAWFTATSYASGPDLRVVGADEYQAAKYVWDSAGDGGASHCILADTWVLLPLEALSSGMIVGGGFPIDYQFAQPERVVLFSELLRNPRESVLTVAKNKTGADVCFAVYNATLLTYSQNQALEEFFSTEPVVFGDQRVYVYPQ